ncbi:hypothetical protein D3C81_1313260 [compost metagenome]
MPEHGNGQHPGDLRQVGASSRQGNDEAGATVFEDEAHLGRRVLGAERNDRCAEPIEREPMDEELRTVAQQQRHTLAARYAQVRQHDTHPLDFAGDIPVSQGQRLVAMLRRNVQERSRLIFLRRTKERSVYGRRRQR